MSQNEKINLLRIFLEEFFSVKKKNIFFPEKSAGKTNIGLKFKFSTKTPQEIIMVIFIRVW